MFKTMSGRDVVVRLLDPPLHEFLDNPRELEVAITKKEAAGASEEELAVLRTRLRRIDGMVESNPMLGLRGVRLSVVFSDLPLMQVRAVATAAARLIKEGVDPRPEIMRSARLHHGGACPDPRGHRAGNRRGFCRGRASSSISPWARCSSCHAPAWSLTRSRVMPTSSALAPTTSPRPPSASLVTMPRLSSSRCTCTRSLEGRPLRDRRHGGARAGAHGRREGPRHQPRHALWRVRRARRRPQESIKGLFNVADVDYVSCSPYRVPLARLAAAQAKLEAKRSA